MEEVEWWPKCGVAAPCGSSLVSRPLANDGDCVISVASSSEASGSPQRWGHLAAGDVEEWCSKTGLTAEDWYLPTAQIVELIPISKPAF